MGKTSFSSFTRRSIPSFQKKNNNQAIFLSLHRQKTTQGGRAGKNKLTRKKFRPFIVFSVANKQKRRKREKQSGHDRKREESKLGEMLSSLSIRIAWEGQYYYTM